jgi:glycosyltransferase involved in cell wall biosynthesis
MKDLIIHVAEVEVSEASGMGRTAWHWKNELEKRGYDFEHIGPAQVGIQSHRALFPYLAYQAYKRIGRRAALFLVHEPTSGAFLKRDIPTVVFSHGIERRWWQLVLQGKDGSTQKIRWRTKLLFPLWRLRQCDLGLQKAAKLLLVNQEDTSFVQNHYHRQATDIHKFRNGVYPSTLNEQIQPENQITILFLGSWIERKGIRTLIEAAQILHERGLRVNWLLAGTSVEPESVLNYWPSTIHPWVEIISHFPPASEESIFARANIFILPSFFEGQPLALLQAMEAGRCCITTNCCGQRDLIQDRYNGLLHQAGDAQHLATLIEECVNDEALRKTLGRNAKFSVKNRSWETVASEVADCVEETLLQHKAVQV